MKTTNTAAISFGNGLAPGQSVVTDGYTGSFNTSWGNLLIASGNTAGGACQLTYPGLSAIIYPGATAIGTITFTGCTNALTSNLQIVLGNSTVGVLDSSNNYIVNPGQISTCTVVPPGNSGAVGCTVNY